MKNIVYNMKVKKVGSDDSTAWEEEMNYMVNENVTSKEHAQMIINDFNSSLKPKESARVLMSVTEVKKNSAKMYHIWEKQNFFTASGGYDIYKCFHCGATGKRIGLNRGITPDDKFDYHCK